MNRPISFSSSAGVSHVNRFTPLAEVYNPVLKVSGDFDGDEKTDFAF
jgi:hypothetical protein